MINFLLLIAIVEVEMETGQVKLQINLPKKISIQTIEANKANPLTI